MGYTVAQWPWQTVYFHSFIHSFLYLVITVRIYYVKGIFDSEMTNLNFLGFLEILTDFRTGLWKQIKQAKIYNAKVKSVPVEAPCSHPTVVSVKESGSWLHYPQKAREWASWRTRRSRLLPSFWQLNCLRSNLEFLVQSPVRLSLGLLILV